MTQTCFPAVGLGVGLVFIPSIVVLTHHFTRRLPLAVAVASSGQSLPSSLRFLTKEPSNAPGLGVGVFLFPPVVRLLEARWGWRTAVLVYAAVCLLMLLSAAVFKVLFAFLEGFWCD